MFSESSLQHKKVGIIANTTWNIYNFRLNFIRRLIENGHDVYVIAPVDEYISYKEKFPDVKHVSIKYLTRKNSNPFKDFRLLLELKGIYASLNLDLVIHYTHKPNIYGALAARWNGIKSVAVVTGLGYAFLHDGLINKITRALYKLTSRFHRKIIFENSDDLKLFVDQKIIGTEKANSVEGCGVDTAIYLPASIEKTDNKFIFTFIGRLLYDKGIREFVEAAKQTRLEHPNAEFWVIGDFDNGNPSMVKKQNLIEWIESGNIIYHGFIEDVRPSIAQSDCIVLPSYREGMPRTILEALSMAKPVITTNVAGCRQTVDGNGFLVSPQNVDELVKAFKDFIALDADTRQEMGEKGRKMALERFNSEKISKDLYEIISHL